MRSQINFYIFFNELHGQIFALSLNRFFNENQIISELTFYEYWFSFV